MRSILVVGLFVGLGLVHFAHAQSSEIQARAAFLKAQEHYGNGSYKEAVERLLTAKQLLQSTNPRIEYLLTKCYLEVDDVKGADASMKKYFEMAAETDMNYNEMLLIIDDIDQKKKQETAREAKLAQERQMWEQTVAANTPAAYTKYMAMYPSGQFVAEATAKFRSFPVEPPIEPVSGRAYQIVKIGDQYWMAENVIYDGSDFIHYRDRYDACPTGWRLPDNEDYADLIKVLDPNVLASKPVELGSGSGIQYFYSKIPFLHLAQTDGNGKKWQSDNLAGFNAVPVASKGGSPYSQIPNTANYWTSDGYFTLSPAWVSMAIFYASYVGPSQQAKMPCRCVRF